jgi:hypothetical protein
MSSEISTDAGDRAAAHHGPAAATPEADGLRPWQFFLLGGMLAATAAVVVATGQPLANLVVLSLTVIAVSLVGLGTYRMLLPFVAPDQLLGGDVIGGRTRAALEREKALALRAIKELEFDRAMGKVAQADFDEMSGRLRARAVRLIRALDDGGGYRADIERELARRLGTRRPATAAAAAPPAAAPAPAAAATRSAPACVSCGTGNDADARFCKGCGAPLAATV